MEKETFANTGYKPMILASSQTEPTVLKNPRPVKANPKSFAVSLWPNAINSIKNIKSKDSAFKGGKKSRRKRKVKRTRRNQYSI